MFNRPYQVQYETFSLGQTDPRYEGQPDCIPAQGTFTPSVHAHVRRTPAHAANRAMSFMLHPAQQWRAVAGAQR